MILWFDRFGGNYGLLAALGAAAALLVLWFNLWQKKYAARDIIKVLLAAAAAVVAGSIASNVGNWFFGNLWDLPLEERIREAGFTWYPGMLAALGVLALLVWAFRQPVPKTMNEAAPSFPLFHAFGRAGCMLAGCCYGAEAQINLLGLHLDRVPTQAIEGIFCLALFFVLEFAIEKHRLPVYLVAYAVFRFIIEFFRGDDRGVFFPGSPLSPAQWISIFVLCGTAAVLLVMKKKKAEE